MNSVTKKLGFLVLLGLFALGANPAAFAGDQDNPAAVSDRPAHNQVDRLAAKALTDDELAEVSAGAFFTHVSVNKLNVFNAGLNGANGVFVNPSARVRVFSLRVR